MNNRFQITRGILKAQGNRKLVRFFFAQCIYLDYLGSCFPYNLPILKQYKKIKDNWYRKELFKSLKKSIYSEIKVLILIAGKDIPQDNNLDNLSEKAGRYLPEKARLIIEALNLPGRKKNNAITDDEIYQISKELVYFYAIVDRQVELLLNCSV